MEAANDNVEGKVCAKCNQWFPLDWFHKQPGGRLGRHSWCRPCANEKQRVSRTKNATPDQRRKWGLMARYGMTVERFEAVLSSQGGRCAICREVPSRPCVDHNHETGQVRGILCHHCNIRLATIEDATYRIGAITYLELHAQRTLESAA